MAKNYELTCSALEQELAAKVSELDAWHYAPTLLLQFGSKCPRW